MQSFSKYASNKFTYINSINTPSVPINESEYLSRDGKAIDSVFRKMSIYNSHYGNSNIFESSSKDSFDIYFTYNEQIAIRDTFCMILENYMYEMLRDEGLIDEGLADALKSSYNIAKEKLTNISKEVSDKFKLVKEFINDIKNKAIKSVKELVDKVVDMMLALGCNVMRLCQKLKIDGEQAQAFLKEKVSDAFKDKAITKSNIYESLGKNYDMLNEEQINEFIGFGKKKESNEKTSKSNEYADAANAVADKDKGKLTAKGIFKAIGSILLQMLAYAVVAVLIPAIVTLIAGPVAGFFAEAIAKIIWSGVSMWKLIKNERKLRKTDEWKKKKKVGKAIHTVVFAISIICSVGAAISGVADLAKGINALINGNLAGILPSEVVQNVTKILNDFWKKLTGGDAPGYDKLLEAQNAVENGITKTVEEIPEETASTDGIKNVEDTLKGTDYNGSSTKMLKDAVSNKGLVSTPGETVIVVDGSAASGPVKRLIQQISDATGIPADEITSKVVNNAGVQAASNGAGGSVTLLSIPMDATSVNVGKLAGCTYEYGRRITSFLADGGVDVSAGNGATMMALVSKLSSPVVKTIVEPIAKIASKFVPFAGLMKIPSVSNVEPNNAFRLRVGSGRTGGYVYDITETKDITYKELQKILEKKNSSVYSKMTAIIKTNYDACKKRIDELKENLDTKEDKEQYNLIINKYNEIDKYVNGDDGKILIFYGILKTKPKTSKSRDAADTSKNTVSEAQTENQSENKEPVPVVFVNPMLMCAGDIASGRSKGPRKNLYYLKGINSRLEFLPVKGGMSAEDIYKMLGNIMKESVKANWNVVWDMPCDKEKDKYVINKQSHYTDDEKRADFGNFTNTELTNIMNDPDSIIKYIGGEHADDSLTGIKHDYIEHTNSEKQKEHRKKVVEEIKDILKDENSESHKYMKDNRDLRKVFVDKEGHIIDENFDKLVNLLLRVEQSYGTTKKAKKSLFDKVKSLFGGKDEDDDIFNKVDNKKLTKLALLLNSERNERKKLKAKENKAKSSSDSKTTDSKSGNDDKKAESYEYDEENSNMIDEDYIDYDNFGIVEANLMMIEREFDAYINEGILEGEDISEDLLIDAEEF